uniref:Small-subunit processome Utp21 domain-containing protein n=1 Tax=Rhodosorus marinus TaxID=101924 RepID=A0A7S2ZIH4_9RHOD|mmetsp:Transcript_19632/g.78163  ORF Transcript_19632/g.78163 Transcript_19632/m.78163 type:complete len:876 (+) Transcript_19632:149-2776(+)
MGLYSDYRVLGLVCDGPAQGSCGSLVNSLGSKWFVTCPVDKGRSVHLYDVSALRLKGSAKVCSGSESIAVLAAADEVTFAAVGRDIVVLKRMKQVETWSAHEDAITSLLVFGNYLLSVSANENRIIAWNREDGEIASDFYVNPGFYITTITHPPTYLNKVLLGGKDGSLQLWNIRTMKLIHEFRGFGSAITNLEPSSVVDVVAVGHSDGNTVLHNFRFDESVLSFKHSEESSVTGLCFRSDGDESLVSSHANGDLAVWDLNERRLRMISHEVHKGGVATSRFTSGEPVLITTGMTDNCLKVHIFDQPDGSPRVLRSRSGHVGPPVKVRFCGGDGRQLISAGLDRELRVISTIRDAQNRVISQKALRKRKRRSDARIRSEVVVDDQFAGLPPVVDIAVGAARREDEDFANIVTVHEGIRGAFTWRMESGALASHVLKTEDDDNANANGVSMKVTSTSVQISPAGHIAFVGCSDGSLSSYNLQSGRLVASSPQKHKARITAIAIDAIGETLVSGSDDQSLKFWDAHTMQASGQPIILNSGIELISWSVDSDLIAVGCDDLSIRIYDAETRKLARRLKGHSARITDLCFAPSGRWILSSSMDASLRTWDLLAGVEVDKLDCESPPTSIALSPEGSFVAVVFAGQVGISLLVNKAHFGAASMSLGKDDHQDQTGEQLNELDVSVADDLVTLSSVPVSQWIILSNLELVRERNKPKVPVKKSESAPFFLPTTSGLNPSFDVKSQPREIVEQKRDRALGSLLELSEFGRLCVDGKYAAALDLAKKLGPSGIDLQLRSIEDADSQLSVLKYFVYALSLQKDFDLVEAHMDLFLRIHGSQLAEERQCAMQLRELKAAHEDAWTDLRDSFSMVLTLTAHFSGQQ